VKIGAELPRANHLGTFAAADVAVMVQRLKFTVRGTASRLLKLSGRAGLI
jgi:hypothetical protein